MEDLHLDQLLIPIPCGDRGNRIEKTIGWIKNNTKHWCPHCHVEIDLSTKPYRDGITNIDRAVSQLQKAILDLEIAAAAGYDAGGIKHVARPSPCKVPVGMVR